jgi:AcrR family transcriptional regulator
MKRGKYELKRRAERQHHTHQKIIETAVELHTTYGPEHTTITDIARRAGVERKTVYNHFPDELSLLKACSAHNRALNPPPDPEPWKLIGDPEERLRRALAELYAYYRTNEQLLANVTRDAQANPNVRRVMEPRLKHQQRMRDVLAVGWQQGDAQQQQQQQRHNNNNNKMKNKEKKEEEDKEKKEKKKVYGALWVALEFQTWRALVRQEGFEDEEVIEVMVGMVRCL